MDGSARIAIGCQRRGTAGGRVPISRVYYERRRKKCEDLSSSKIDRFGEEIDYDMNNRNSESIIFQRFDGVPFIFPIDRGHSTTNSAADGGNVNEFRFFDQNRQFFDEALPVETSDKAKKMEECKHVQQLSNDIFLQPTTNPREAGVATVVIGSMPINNVAGGAPSASTNDTPATSASKSKKKKNKKAPSLQTLRASLLPPPRHQCSQCHRSYGNRRDLRRHVLAHHQGIRYMCRLCCKTMMSSKSVRAHLKSSAHRLSDVDEIALNIEKVTPGSTTGVAGTSANASSSTAPRGKK